MVLVSRLQLVLRISILTTLCSWDYSRLRFLLDRCFRCPRRLQVQGGLLIVFVCLFTLTESRFTKGRVSFCGLESSAGRRRRLARTEALPTEAEK